DAPDALLAQAGLGRHQQLLEDALPRLVVGDEVEDRVALGRGVLGVAADVQVEPGAVGQEDVARPPPRHDAPEQVPGHLVRAEPALPPQRAGDAVLVLQAEDAPIHPSTPSAHRPFCRTALPCPHATAVPPEWGRHRAEWARPGRTRGARAPGAGTVVPVTIGPMVALTTTTSPVVARVLAAHLGAEGIVWQLRGNVDGPYPVGPVEVLVTAEDVERAREVVAAHLAPEALVAPASARSVVPVTIGPMVPLTTTTSPVVARVLAAHLGAEGIVWQLRGNVDGPYPVGPVEVLVTAEDVERAREVVAAHLAPEDLVAPASA